jgi:serine/threonine protein kinase
MVLGGPLRCVESSKAFWPLGAHGLDCLHAGSLYDYLLRKPATEGSRALKFALSTLKGHQVSMDSKLCALLTILDIAEALKFLHRNSILHGDLKPQNILLCKAETVRPITSRETLCTFVYHSKYLKSLASVKE